MQYEDNKKMSKGKPKVVKPGDVLVANYAKVKNKYDDIGMKDKDIDKIKLPNVSDPRNTKGRVAPTNVKGLRGLGDIPQLIKSGIGRNVNKGK